MVARRKTLHTSGVACIAFIAACLALLLAFPRIAQAGTIPIYSVEVSNSYIAPPGSSRVSGGFTGFFGGSVLEQWIDQSRPYVRVTNISSQPAMNLWGAELDLTDSASMVIACDWVEGLGAPAQTWNWNADLTAAFFQFRTPLAPGESVLMRLSTAPRPGLEMDYKQNQSLFHPATGDCLCETDNFASMNVFGQEVGATEPVTFLPSGQPESPELVSRKTTFDAPLTPPQILNPLFETETVVVAPVPEPSSVALAASAAIVLAFAARRGIRRSRLAA